MTGRVGVIACLAAGLTAGAACNAAQDVPGKAAEVQNIEPGLYEVKVTPLSAEFDDPGTTAQMGTLMGRPQTSRECHGGRPAVVGGAGGGGCSFTRIGDRGGTVERTAQCASRRPDRSRSMTITGTRSRDRYDYRIRLTSRTRDGRIVGDVVVREEGRRLGPCPEGTPPREAG